MNIVTLDFETYFDHGYTLSKMTTEEYIRDRRFKVHGAGIRWPDGSAQWCDGDAFAHALQQLDFGRTACLAHHAHFEGLILSHHYGLTPGLWLDTLPMARLLLGNHVKGGLDKLATHFGLPNKTVPYEQFRGLYWHQMGDDLRARVSAGCLHDGALTWTIFNELARSFPVEEYGVVDATVRMFTEPCVLGDTQMFAAVWRDELNETYELLLDLGFTAEQVQSGEAAKALRSNEVLAELFRRIGVEPEYKAGKNGPIFAFAKSDDFMRDLQENGEDDARLLVDARIRAQSTNAQTRAERLGWMSTRGAMCVYINAYGAHTTRDSGGDKVNYQNFKRADPANPKRGRIRQAHGAPTGYKIGVVDASQIECRMLNEFAGQHDIVQKFREKRDLYSELATQFYGFEVTKKLPAERGTGKQLELSCGYGAGAFTIQQTAKKGIYGPPVYLTMDQAEDAKQLYRSTHSRVEASWKYATDVIKVMCNSDCDFMWNCLRVKCDTATGRKRIILPNGCELIFDTLEWYVPTQEECAKIANEWKHKGYFRMKSRRGYVDVYGAKLIENIIQALARVHLMQVMLRIRAAGIRIWMRCHDELAMLIKDDGNAQATIEWCAEQMKIPPAWMPNVPLDAEFMLGDRYEK